MLWLAAQLMACGLPGQSARAQRGLGPVWYQCLCRASVLCSATTAGVSVCAVHRRQLRGSSSSSSRQQRQQRLSSLAALQSGASLGPNSTSHWSRHNSSTSRSSCTATAQVSFLGVVPIPCSCIWHCGNVSTDNQHNKPSRQVTASSVWCHQQFCRGGK